METNLANIGSIDISCDIFPPSSEKIIKVGGVYHEILVCSVGQAEHSRTFPLGPNPASVLMKKKRPTQTHEI